MSDHEQTRKGADAVGIGIWIVYLLCAFCAVAGLAKRVSGDPSNGLKWAAGFFALGIVLIFLRNVMLIRAEVEEMNHARRVEREEETQREKFHVENT